MPNIAVLCRVASRVARETKSYIYPLSALCGGFAVRARHCDLCVSPNIRGFINQMIGYIKAISPCVKSASARLFLDLHTVYRVGAEW